MEKKRDKRADAGYQDAERYFCTGEFTNPPCCVIIEPDGAGDGAFGTAFSLPGI